MAVKEKWIFGAFLLFAATLVFPSCHVKPLATVRDWPDVTFEPDDRILVLAPHPDDEVLGCSSVIQEARLKTLPVRVVFLTYGDANEWSFLIYKRHPMLSATGIKGMGEVRYDEAVAAARHLGLSVENLTFLGYPDSGCLTIWDRHWGKSPPLHNMLTDADAVPYANALLPGAPYKGEEILTDLRSVLRQFKPTKIFVSHPADHHPDHRALYLFLRVALWELQDEMQPQILPYLIHYKNWPLPRGDHPDKRLYPPDQYREQIPWLERDLTPAEIERKRAALKAHRTQFNSSAKYLSTFIRANEMWGDFPVVTLHAANAQKTLTQRKTEDAAQPPKELTGAERDAFIGFESRHLRLVGDRLEFSVTLSRPLAKETEMSLYVFGYRRDKPFGEMPKIHVVLGEFHHFIEDQRRHLDSNEVTITRDSKHITMSLSLDTLGNPERILTSARTYFGDVAMDWVSWRVVELPANGK